MELGDVPVKLVILPLKSVGVLIKIVIFCKLSVAVLLELVGVPDESVGVQV